MSFLRTWFRTPRVRRGLAAGAIVLAAGGLVLARTPAGAQTFVGASSLSAATGSNAATFSGTGARGSFALSHSRVLAGGEQQVFAELDLRAEAGENQRERAPLSIAVV